MHATPRRKFLKSTGFTLAGLGLLNAGRTLAIEPFQRAGLPRFSLSLAAYSFRDFFKDVNSRRATDPAPAKPIDLFQFIDFCAAHGCDGAELTSYYFPPKADRDFFLQLRRHAFVRGIAISGTAVGNTFTHPPGTDREKEIAHVKRWIDHAAVMGAPHIRIFAGNAPEGVPAGETRKHCISAIEECCQYASGKGIFLGLENHGGIVAEADQLLEIVRAVKSPWFGVNLDTGNFHSDDIYGDITRCAPYAVNVQVKGEIRARGKPAESADLGRLVKILRDANFQGFVALEYESKEDPWVAVPRLLSRLKELLAQA